MHCASYNDQTEILQTLITHGGEVNVVDDLGRTALMYAAMAGQTGVIDLLLDAGSELLARDKRANTALHFACMHVRTVYWLGILWGFPGWGLLMELPGCE